MMRDIARNHPRIEHSAIVGDLCRYADSLGVPTPLMDTAHSHLQVYAVAHGQDIA
jgi:ketopantoate reductase